MYPVTTEVANWDRDREEGVSIKGTHARMGPKDAQGGGGGGRRGPPYTRDHASAPRREEEERAPLI